MKTFAVFSVMTLICAAMNVGCVSEEPYSDACGAYTSWRDVSPDDVAVFKAAVKDVSVVPQEVASQVVAGTNFRFRYLDENGKGWIWTIFQPLPGQGEPRLTKFSISTPEE